MRNALRRAGARGILVIAGVGAGAIMAQERTLPLNAVRSGISFASPDLQRLQADAFANPGMLWVERGEKLWSARTNNAKSCADCHDVSSTSMRDVRLRFPKFDVASGTLRTLEDQVNQCRSKRQAAPTWAFESEPLLSLTAFLSHQSHGAPINRQIDATLTPFFEQGRSLYFSRIGQYNLACHHCHEQNAGKRLLQETLSQGHGSGYPAYRFEWQSVGSLQRRLRACFSGVRAIVPAYGSQELAALELYLQWRGAGLAVETPAVRR